MSSSSTHVIDFELVLKVEKISEAFMRHLKREQNTHPLEFLLEHDRYARLEHRSVEQVREARRLFDSYISPTSHKQVNLPSSSYKEIESKLKELEASNTEPTFQYQLLNRS